MPAHASHPPVHPDIKRELKQHLLALSARSFELFASDFLVYAGLEAVTVTRYSGDGGIDALGDLIAGRFRLPVGIQVKRYRHNVQRPDIDRFVGALSGRFAEGMFLTTANYAPAALHKASTSIPRVLTIDGDHLVSIMVEHRLGLQPSPLHDRGIEIDPDYFAAFETMKSLFAGRLREVSQNYTPTDPASMPHCAPDEQPIELRPEEDLISLNALGYALRVDPARVRRWVEDGTLHPDASQPSGERTRYYFRRDRIVSLRSTLGLGTIPASSDEWKQEFLDFASSRTLTKSYKPVMLKAFFALVDREGTVKLDDLARVFRDSYIQSANTGQPLERGNSLMAHPTTASDQAVKRLIITHPLERFLIKQFMQYVPEEGLLRIAPILWQALHYYEVVDILRSADEQIRYYVARSTEK